MTRPLAIEGANLVLRCPPGTPNCHDIYVKQEVIEGVLYRTMELELEPHEREAVLNGGTLRIRQMGDVWVPVASWIEPAPVAPWNVIPDAG